MSPIEYLNALVDKEIHMMQSAGFIMHPRGVQRALVFQLKRAIYGLQQAGERWRSLLQTLIIDMGYAQCWDTPETNI